MSISVTMSMAAAEGLLDALVRYRPSGDDDRHQKSLRWLRSCLAGKKGDVTLTAKPGNLLWLAEQVAKPGAGYAAAAAIIPALSKAGRLPPPEPVDAAKLAAELKRDIASGTFDWAMTGW
jgi:hypothetical protein